MFGPLGTFWASFSRSNVFVRPTLLTSVVRSTVAESCAQRLKVLVVDMMVRTRDDSGLQGGEVELKVDHAADMEAACSDGRGAMAEGVALEDEQEDENPVGVRGMTVAFQVQAVLSCSGVTRTAFVPCCNDTCIHNLILTSHRLSFEDPAPCCCNARDLPLQNLSQCISISGVAATARMEFRATLLTMHVCRTLSTS